MNILVLEDSSQSKYGGGQKISRLVIELLAPTHTLFLFNTESNGYFMSDVKSHIKSKLILEAPKFYLPFFKRFLQLFYFFKSIFIIKRFLINNKIELVYATTKWTLLIAFFLHKYKNVPFVYHAHMAHRRTIMDYLLVRLMVNAKTVVAVSNYVKDSIFNLNSKVTVNVVYNPVEFEIGLPKLLQTKKIYNVCYFGTIKKQKGIDDLIQAARIFSKINLPVKFHFFGEGDLMGDIFAVTTNIQFHGHVSDVENKLLLTDILVLPSIIPEACPTIILQAMSKGIPVITTNIGGQCELIKNESNGLLVEVNNPESISRAIERLLSSSELYDQVSRNNLIDITGMPNKKSYEISLLNIINN
jgi:glycosyltransferase involved in cell wall biosynthesis